MYFYRAYGLAIRSEIELPELKSELFEGEPDLTVTIGRIELPVLQPTKIYRRGISAQFGEGPNGQLILSWDDVANYKAISGTELVVDPCTSDKTLLSLFTVSEALGLILFQRGYFLLHASAVTVGNEGWCFMGDPGAGKSTSAAAFVKQGRPLLSDDLTAIYFDSGNAYILPAYPQLKIWDKTAAGLSYDGHELKALAEGVNKFAHFSDDSFDTRPVKLAHIFFLESEGTEELTKLSAFDAPSELLRHFPLAIPMLTKEVLKKHFEDSITCYQRASLWKKKREKSFPSLETWVQECLTQHSPVS